jgi:hypothetical protein|tara:strand:+ start:217 stop:423 length:207 start_codon:yes stop_codon:yes gene_type:complete
MARWGYRANSNISTSCSVRQKDEEDYFNLRNLLQKERVSLVEYALSHYRDNDKEQPDTRQFMEIRRSR